MYRIQKFNVNLFNVIKMSIHVTKVISIFIQNRVYFYCAYDAKSFKHQNYYSRSSKLCD